MKRRPQARAVAISPADALDQRGLPIVAELARVARGEDPPAVKLETALDVLFGAYGKGDPEFSGLFLTGWMRARDDKHCRLAVAWHREQLRLCLAEILAEGVAGGALRSSLDPDGVAALILGAAESCLLQTATGGGAVSAPDVVRAVLTLALNGA